MRRNDDESEGPVDAALGAEPAADLRLLRDAPGPDPARWEALARRVEAAAAPELARRRELAARGRAYDLAPVLARALRPALLAAAAALLLAVGLTRGAAAAGASDGNAGAELVRGAAVAQALSVRDPDAAWLAEAQAPSAEALAHAIGVETGP